MIDNFLNTAHSFKMKTPAEEFKYADFSTVEPKDGKNFSVLEMKPAVTVIVAENNVIQCCYDGEQVTAETIKSILVNENFVRVNNKLYKLYKILGEDHKNTYVERKITKWQRFVMKLFHVEFPFYGTSPKNIILLFSSIIGADSKRSLGNFCVVSPKIASLLSYDSSFVHSSEDNFLEQTAIKFIGSLNEKIAVFVNYYLKFDDNCVVVGRNAFCGEPGVVHAEFSESFDVIELNEQNLRKKKMTLSVRDAIAPVGKFPAVNYFTDTLLLEKKPWYRKLLKL